METIHFSHFPNQISTLNAAIFHSVPKPEELLDRLSSNKDGNQEEIQFAFVDSTKIISRNHLMTAIHQAMLSATNSIQSKDIDANRNGMSHSAVKGGMRARNFNAEILWKLSPSSNISESLKSFGLSPRTSSLIIISIGPPPSSSTTSSNLLSKMISLTNGGILIEQGLTILDEPNGDRMFKGLESIDWQAIDRIYKLGNYETGTVPVKTTIQFGKVVVEFEKQERIRMDRLITSLVAMKSVNV